MRSRRLQFHFRFPPIYGIYDTGEGAIYVFGEHDGKIEDILSHEVLHWAVQKIAGKQASLDLDNIPPKLLRREEHPTDASSVTCNICKERF